MGHAGCRPLADLTMLATRILAVCFGVSVLAGCVGPQVQPRAQALLRMKSIHIVPMETPPLSIDANYASTGPASIAPFLPRYTVGMARTVGVLSGIVLLLDVPELLSRRLELPPSVQIQISPTETWNLSVELAREASRLAAATGKTSTLSSAIEPIPGLQDRGRTVLMENWMAPLRAWYNDALPSTRYVVFAAEGLDAIAEVGISNYEIFSGKLLLQVNVKLLDPASGQLLGRARASSFTELPSMDEAFAADAKRFKESVSSAGNRLILTCLQELGVVPK